MHGEPSRSVTLCRSLFFFFSGRTGFNAGLQRVNRSGILGAEVGTGRFRGDEVERTRGIAALRYGSSRDETEPRVQPPGCLVL